MVKENRPDEKEIYYTILNINYLFNDSHDFSWGDIPYWLNTRLSESSTIDVDRLNRHFQLIEGYYVSDIKKSLFHMDGIDRSMLRRWHNDKIDSITNKSIKVQVGHKDLLLYKK